MNQYRGVAEDSVLFGIELFLYVVLRLFDKVIVEFFAVVIF